MNKNRSLAVFTVLLMLYGTINSQYDKAQQRLREKEWCKQNYPNQVQLCLNLFTRLKHKITNYILKLL